MAKIRSPKDVMYLSFEGGGGMGVAYVGALKAMEELGILPIVRGKREKNQIKGISGASAGAITALTIALGITADTLNKYYLSKPEIFNAFFDDPKPGIIRGVGDNNIPFEKKLRNPSDIVNTFKDIGIKFSTLPLAGLANIALGLLAPEDAKVLANKLSHEHYLNLFRDGGLFPGFEVRNFFRELIWDFIAKQAKLIFSAKQCSDFERIGISFKDFFKLTGIDFVVMGTNISTKQAGIFSIRNTPDFLVNEAVALSMSIPFVFKPICLEINHNAKGLDKDFYRGYWCDGGVRTNFPIHAFDGINWRSPYLTPPNQFLKPLNANMLGLRVDKSVQLVENCTNPRDINKSVFSVFGDVWSTMAYPSSAGQIRDSSENEQVIFIDAFELSLLNFAPADSIKKKPIDEAYKKVMSYFPGVSKGGGASGKF